eukprot:Skav210167  [mRNA]  locus=scaffold483:41054:41809:- [translate_table: standard]
MRVVGDAVTWAERHRSPRAQGGQGEAWSMVAMVKGWSMGGCEQLLGECLVNGLLEALPSTSAKRWAAGTEVPPVRVAQADGRNLMSRSGVAQPFHFGNRVFLVTSTPIFAQNWSAVLKSAEISTDTKSGESGECSLPKDFLFFQEEALDVEAFFKVMKEHIDNHHVIGCSMDGNAEKAEDRPRTLLKD